MKSTSWNILIASLLSGLMLLMAGCKDRDEVQPVSFEVQLVYPVDFVQRTVGAGIEVQLRSTTGGASFTRTSSSEGKVVFERVLPGSYELSATQALSAQQALTITGKFNEPINLNGLSNLVVAPSPLTGQTATLELSGLPSGSLVFKEVYYTGVPPFYFSDQFVEIYNNTDQVIFLDGLCIADVFGNAGQINASSLPTPFAPDQQHVYLNSVWRIPGNGNQHPLAPGRSIIIAQDGINHRAENPNSTVDLSRADWETYNERPDGRDVDSPTVPNLERLYFTGGFDWLVPVFGPALVIFRTNNFDALERVPVPDAAPTFPPRIKLPVGLVIDAFEALRDAESGSFKRIPAALDAGFFFASGTYTGESARRKLAIETNGRKLLQDTNNSSNDFQLLRTPTPRVLP